MKKIREMIESVQKRDPQKEGNALSEVSNRGHKQRSAEILCRICDRNIPMSDWAAHESICSSKTTGVQKTISKSLSSLISSPSPLNIFFSDPEIRHAGHSAWIAT